MDAQSCHTISYGDRKQVRSRRETLKETLKKSVRSMNLDTSPLSDSIHDPPMTLPLRSRSYHGATRTDSTPATASTTVLNAKRSVQALPKRTASGTSARRHGRRKTSRALSADSDSLHQRMTTTAKEESSYLPTALQTNRRTMMQKQSSFVTGSRIRTLRA